MASWFSCLMSTLEERRRETRPVAVAGAGGRRTMHMKLLKMRRATQVGLSSGFSLRGSMWPWRGNLSGLHRGGKRLAACDDQGARWESKKLGCADCRKHGFRTFVPFRPNSGVRPESQPGTSPGRNLADPRADPGLAVAPSRANRTAGSQFTIHDSETKDAQRDSDDGLCHRTWASTPPPFLPLISLAGRPCSRWPLLLVPDHQVASS